MHDDHSINFLHSNMFVLVPYSFLFLLGTLAHCRKSVGDQFDEVALPVALNPGVSLWISVCNK